MAAWNIFQRLRLYFLSKSRSVYNVSAAIPSGTFVVKFDLIRNRRYSLSDIALSSFSSWKNGSLFKVDRREGQS
jgi:hypothetical protein